MGGPGCLWLGKAEFECNDFQMDLGLGEGIVARVWGGKSREERGVPL